MTEDRKKKDVSEIMFRWLLLVIEFNSCILYTLYLSVVSCAWPFYPAAITKSRLLTKSKWGRLILSHGYSGAVKNKNTILTCFQLHSFAFRELGNWRRGGRGRRLVKNEWVYLPSNLAITFVQCVYWSKTDMVTYTLDAENAMPLFKIVNRNAFSKINRAKIHRIWSFYVVVFQRKAKKCSKIYNSRAKLLFCT